MENVISHVCHMTAPNADEEETDYAQDLNYGERLLIHRNADKREERQNVIAARIILEAFPETKIKIREHHLEEGVKNPEYEINGMLADRKGIESERGIKWGFISAIKQGCQIVVIDLNDRMWSKPLRPNTIARMIKWRHRDFELGTIKKCYVLYHERAVEVNAVHLETGEVPDIIKKLKPQNTASEIDATA